MSELAVVEKLEAAKMTKSFVLNGQSLTDVPEVVLEDEWCRQYLQSLYLKNNLICRVVSVCMYNYSGLSFCMQSERITQLKSLTQMLVYMLIDIICNRI